VETFQVIGSVKKK